MVDGDRRNLGPTPSARYRLELRNMPDRCGLLRITVIVGLLAGFALSPKLWLSSRLYPLTPVWSFFKAPNPPVDRLLLLTLTALLIILTTAPRREIAAAALALLFLLALQDQSRWQPWFYQYLLMFLAIAVAGREHPESALQTCRLIVAATYFWSGLAKLNPNFFTAVFPSLFSPFLATVPPALNHLAFLAPIVECGAGIGLLTERYRSQALFCAAGMHGFILLAIGPVGSRFNTVVWPWNLAMIAILFILFLRRVEKPPFHDIRVPQKIIVGLFAVMPALSLVNLWDHYLSSSLYSGNRTSGLIYFNDNVFDRLPEALQEYVSDEGPDRGSLDINDWSLGELNVPSYPEPRIYRNVGRRICRYGAQDSSIELVVRGQLSLFRGGRSQVYHCRDLLGP